jgi:hypothetical protein
VGKEAHQRKLKIFNSPARMAGVIEMEQAREQEKKETSRMAEV